MATPLIRFTGIDPGIVDTGIVTFTFSMALKQLVIDARVVKGLDAKTIADRAQRYGPGLPVFIEAYRPRSNMQYDNEMVARIAEIKKAIPGSIVLNNTGVKKVVRQPLMEALGVWKFNQATHHQDLRSAARIGIYGAMKDEALNQALTSYMTDYADDPHQWTRM